MTIENRQAGPQWQTFLGAPSRCVSEGIVILLGAQTPRLQLASALPRDGGVVCGSLPSPEAPGNAACQE